MAKEDVGQLYNSTAPGLGAAATPPPSTVSSFMAPNTGVGRGNNEPVAAGLPRWAYNPAYVNSLNDKYLQGQTSVPTPTGQDYWGTGQAGVAGKDFDAWVGAVKAWAETGGGYEQYGPGQLGQYTNYQYDPTMLGQDYAAAMEQYMTALSMYAKQMAAQQAQAASAAAAVGAGAGKPGMSKHGGGGPTGESSIPENPVKKLV